MTRNATPTLHPESHRGLHNICTTYQSELDCHCHPGRHVNHNVIDRHCKSHHGLFIDLRDTHSSFVAIVIAMTHDILSSVLIIAFL